MLDYDHKNVSCVLFWWWITVNGANIAYNHQFAPVLVLVFLWAAVSYVLMTRGFIVSSTWTDYGLCSYIRTRVTETSFWSFFSSFSVFFLFFKKSLCGRFLRLCAQLHLSSVPLHFFFFVSGIVSSLVKAEKQPHQTEPLVHRGLWAPSSSPVH